MARNEDVMSPVKDEIERAMRVAREQEARAAMQRARDERREKDREVADLFARYWWGR